MSSPSSRSDPGAPEPGEVSALLRTAAREELLPRFGHAAAACKADGSVVTEADLALERRLTAALQRRWPSIAVLAEEMDAATQRSVLGDAAGAAWCLDPLDGTSNFAAGLPFFCVSLALVRGGRVRLALVYDPIRDECFGAAEGRGAWCGDRTLQRARGTPPLAQCVAGIDLKRLAMPLAERLVRAAPYRSQRNFGAAALDWCWVAAGRYPVYLHGGQQLWDFAAGSLILEQAGGCSCTLDGETVFRAALGPRSVVAAATPEAFREWCAWLGVTPPRDQT